MIIIFSLLGILGIALILSNLYFIYKYTILQKQVLSYEKIGTGRYGFYKVDSRAIIYVVELDRYKDGYSKIKIDNIEPYNSIDPDRSERSARASFVTLRPTKDIEWLESEDAVRKMRKEKLDQIKKL
jgi:hypothetical protein